MCGIVYTRRIDGKIANKMVAKRYFKQKDRGSDGFGFIYLLKNKIKTKRATYEKNILELLEKTESQEILFHHRFPTSTPNFLEATHPIKVKNKCLKYNYYGVHNGVISNADDLQKKHKKLGFNYTTWMQEKMITRKTEYYYNEQFNDSEALIIDFALYLEKKKKKIEAEGSMAFIIIQTDKKDNPLKIFYARNSQNPLKLYKNKDFITVCSEGSGENIEIDMLHWYNYKTKENGIEKIELHKELSVINDYDYGYGFGKSYKNYSHKDDPFNSYTFTQEEYEKAYTQIDELQNLIDDYETDLYYFNQKENYDESVKYESQLKEANKKLKELREKYEIYDY